MVERIVIAEIKPVIQLTGIFAAQIPAYFKLSKCNIGLVLNFNVTGMKKGIGHFIF
jgi:GxxExxY protein